VVIQQALDLGMALIDSADAYRPYTNEQLVGRALADGRRERAVLATKVGPVCDDPDGPASANSSSGWGRNARREHIRAVRSERRPFAVDLLYGDQVRAQRTISRFAITPADVDRRLGSVGLRWNLDQMGPR
jgi:aryl-alcohol dehydrogenase-like predicted oxidoreductase